MKFIDIPIKIHRKTRQLFLFLPFIFFPSFVNICIKLTFTRINEFMILRDSKLLEPRSLSLRMGHLESRSLSLPMGHLESFTRTSASTFHILKNKASFNTGNIHKHNSVETICLHEGDPLHLLCEHNFYIIADAKEPNPDSFAKIHKNVITIIDLRASQRSIRKQPHLFAKIHRNAISQSDQSSSQPTSALSLESNTSKMNNYIPPNHIQATIF